MPPHPADEARVDIKRLTQEKHAEYIHLCGKTGEDIDALPVETCDRCSMVQQCEDDHIILKESCIERILRQELKKLNTGSGDGRTGHSRATPKPRSVKGRRAKAPKKAAS